MENKEINKQIKELPQVMKVIIEVFKMKVQEFGLPGNFIRNPYHKIKGQGLNKYHNGSIYKKGQKPARQGGIERNPVNINCLLSFCHCHSFLNFR